MSWRKPPKIAVRGQKQPSDCPNTSATPRSSGGGGRLEALSRPKNPAQPKPRSTSKPTPRGSRAATPRVRTTVTRTRSTPGGGDETTIVERVQSGPAAPTKPRYNKQKVMHPEDMYRERKLPVPCKPGQPCPKVKRGEYYSKDVVSLWEQWQRWNEFSEEIKCWQQNRPYVSAREKEKKAFDRWLTKEEEAHERSFKAGKCNVMPFHMRPEKAPKKAVVKGKAEGRRNLPKSPGGKRRYEKKDCLGNCIRYNSVDDANPEDLYKARGQDPPQYVQPPLREDGTFKLPKQRTEAETEAFMAYRKWEDFYFRQQAWDNDKKWEGDPRIQELFKIKTPSRGQGTADLSTTQGRAEARAAERANRRAAAEEKQRDKMSKAEKAAEANLRKLGLKGRKLTGAAKVALQSAARREAAERAAEECKRQMLEQRQKSFLKRGQKSSATKLGRGRVDLRNVKSRIGGLINAGRQQLAVEAGSAPPDCPPAAQMEGPPDCSAEGMNIPSPPSTPYGVWDMNRQSALRNRRSRSLCDRMTGQIRRHLNLTGQMGHLPTTVHFYDVGEFPNRVRGSDVSILNYLPTTPTRSLFSGWGPIDYEGNDEMGCAEQPSDWYEPDEPMYEFGNTFTSMQEPSPPKSIRLGRLPHQPMRRTTEIPGLCGTTENEMFLSQLQMEGDEDRAYRDRVMNTRMNQPLRERAAAMAAQTDMNLLHPSVYRSNIMQREQETGMRQAMASQLGARAHMLQNNLPCIESRPVTRTWDLPSPPPSPRPSSPLRVGELIALDGRPCSPPPPPCTPPPAFAQPRHQSPPRQCSPFEMPERFAGGVNPFLERARAAIEAPCLDIPFRGEEIAAQAARTAAAAQPRRRPDIFGGWDVVDFEADMRDQACLDEALEGVQISPVAQPQVQQAQGDWQWPDFRQCVGPQYGALYHEHMRQPQLGPWHYTPPAGRGRRYVDWDAEPVPEANLVDLGNCPPQPRPRRRNLHSLRPPGPNLCF